MSEIILVDPHLRDEKIFGPDLGLGYLSAKLVDQPARIIDFVTPSIPDNEAYRFLGYEKFFVNKILDAISVDPDNTALGIKCTYLSYSRALHIANESKKAFPHCKVMLGGPHITSMYNTEIWRYQPLIDSPNVDLLVIGEGEQVLEDIALGKPLTEIAGVCLKNDGKIIDHADNILLSDLDIVPFPEWSAWNLNDYPSFLPVTTSRGCAYRCAFCDERLIWGHQYRYRSPENIIGEIERNIDQFGIRNVKFVDSSLTLHPQLDELCDRMIARDLGLKWTCFARVDQVNEKRLEKMKLAGCEMVLFGLESGSQRILDRMRKRFKLDQVQKAVRLCQQQGVAVEGSFMIGFPSETHQEALQSIEFAKELKTESCHWHSFSPSVEMINDADKWGIRFKDLISWKMFDIDKPLSLIAADLYTNPQLILDRHTATFLIENGYSIPDTKGIQKFSYDNSLSIEQISKLLRKAMKETSEIGVSASMDLGYELLGGERNKIVQAGDEFR